MITIWVVFAFIGGNWLEMKDSFSEKEGCMNEINVTDHYCPVRGQVVHYKVSAGWVYYGCSSNSIPKGYFCDDPEEGKYPHAKYPAVCRAREVPAPPR